MAHIDNLIDSIKDPHLRTALRAEYDKVTKSRRLGLVFDRHLPESVVLPGFPIREGEKVQVIADGSADPADIEGSGVWTVTDVGMTHTQLRDGNGETRQVSSGRLVATREFGDPIYPGLVSTGRVVRGAGADGDDGGKPFHTVINAENYHALEALLFAHESQVDAIYIDPPYNTGARDWKYNNDYVDDADPYRHSKWLSFMERRLQLAKRLLKPEGSILIVTIGEKEVNRLGLLLQQTFPGARMQQVTTLINPQGSSAGTGEFSRVEEYIYFVAVGSPRFDKWSRSMVENDKEASDVSADLSVRWADFARYGGNAGRKHSPGAFFPIFVDIASETIHSVGDALEWDADVRHVKAPPGTRTLWPPKRPDGSDGRWRTVAETCRELVEQGYIRVGPYNARSGRHSLSYLQAGTVERIAAGEIVVTGRDAKGAVTVEYAANTKVATPKTIWTLASHDASRHGANLLHQFLPGRRFPYAKSLYAVEDALRFYVKSNPEALVVDFFAGSGTTAHALMRLNAMDGGRRRSILITNNEVSADEARALRNQGNKPGSPQWEALGICEYITKPRIRAAITGRTPDGAPVKGAYRFVDEFPMAQGFRENAEFFTLTYEDPTLVSLGRRFEAIAPLLWLRSGARGDRITEVAQEGWSLPASACYGVLFDPSAWSAFVTAAAGRDDLVHAFIVTDSIVEYQQIVARLDPGLRTTRLYADYLRSFEINTRS